MTDEQFTQIRLAIQSLEDKFSVDGVIESIKKDICEVKEKVSLQNGRVKKLEFWRNGIVAVGSFIIFITPISIWLWDKIK